MCLEDLKTQIFQLRNDCGGRRQTSHALRLNELSDILIDCGKNHPYALNEIQDEFVGKTNIFSEGAQGVLAKIKNANFVYRIQSVGGLLRNVLWSDLSVSPSDPAEVWDKLINDSRRSGDWLKLKRYARGTYPAQANDGNLRFWDFAWWTTHDLQENVMLGATKIGMCSDWVTAKTIVFRSPVRFVEESRVAHVPTVIDAFMQPIFLPVSDTPPPEAGVTIDISNDDLCEGVDEYIIKPLDTEFVEILPFPVGADLVREFGLGREENSRVLRALISYYERL